MPYSIVFRNSAKKDLKKIDRSAQDRILDAIEAIAGDPRGLSDGPLTGRAGQWKLRVGGYRVIFSIEDDVLIIDVIHVRKRGDVYKKRTR